MPSTLILKSLAIRYDLYSGQLLGDSESLLGAGEEYQQSFCTALQVLCHADERMDFTSLFSFSRNSTPFRVCTHSATKCSMGIDEYAKDAFDHCRMILEGGLYYSLMASYYEQRYFQYESLELSHGIEIIRLDSRFFLSTIMPNIPIVWRMPWRQSTISPSSTRRPPFFSRTFCTLSLWLLEMFSATIILIRCSCVIYSFMIYSIWCLKACLSSSKCWQ